MDVLGIGDLVSLAQGRTQAHLAHETSALSSGLRIASAADDPSGLAISENLQSKVNGLDQGVQSLQDANNALNVADGALQAIASILQRLRQLVVQANSDLLSVSDRANVQAETTQLTAEISSISQNTTFNGKQLLDGSLSSSVPQVTSLLIPQNDTLATGGTLLDTTTDTLQPQPHVNNPAQQFIQTLTVNSFDPTTNQLTVTVSIASQDPSFGPTQTNTFTVDNGTNFQSGFFPPTPGSPSFQQTAADGTDVLSFNIGTLTAADVGKTAIVVSVDSQSKAPGQALQVNSGDAEGSTVSVDIPAVNTANLGVNELTISSDPLLNQASEFRIDNGINVLANIQAQIGAQTVALQETIGDASVAAVNTQAAESNIRDANIGATVTAFTKDQLLISVQTAVLSRIQSSAQEILTLFR